MGQDCRTVHLALDTASRDILKHRIVLSVPTALMLQVVCTHEDYRSCCHGNVYLFEDSKCQRLGLGFCG